MGEGFYMEEGRRTSDQLFDEYSNFGKFLDRLENINLHRNYKDINLNELRVLTYISEKDSLYRLVEEKYPKDSELQDILQETGTKKMKENLGLELKQIYDYTRRLNQKGLINRVKHDYYIGSRFFRPTDEGRDLCRSFIKGFGY